MCCLWECYGGVDLFSGLGGGVRKLYVYLLTSIILYKNTVYFRERGGGK